MKCTPVDSVCRHLAVASMRGAVLGVSVEARVIQPSDSNLTIAVCPSCVSKTNVEMYYNEKSSLSCWEGAETVRRAVVEGEWRFELHDGESRCAHFACAHLRELFLAARYGDRSDVTVQSAMLQHEVTGIRAIICSSCVDTLVIERRVAIDCISGAYEFHLSLSKGTN